MPLAASSSAPRADLVHFPRLPAVSHVPPRHRSLKESRSSESLTQRKDRVEFLRQREWTRRAAAGTDHHPNPRPRARTNSWEEIIAAADAAASTFDYNSSGYAGRTDALSLLLDDDDYEHSGCAYYDGPGAPHEEPYVIYTASPRTPSPSAYTSFPHSPDATLIYSTSAPTSSSSAPMTCLSSPSPSPSPPPARDLAAIAIAAGISSAGPYYARRASERAGPHSRHSSLSSISEEDEGLVRL